MAAETTTITDTIEPRPAPPEVEGFEVFHLSDAMLRTLEDLGYEAPTPVQRATIRLLMEGRDVIAQAQTGTGKTAAYGIPMVERIDRELRRPQGLVLAPTRELAVQVAEAIHALGKRSRVDVLPVYGGQPIERQLRGLRAGVHVVVGTPGRLLDHLRRGTLDLSAVTLAILDEADEMLDMGFLEDVEAILTALAEARAKGHEAETEADVQSVEAEEETASEAAKPSVPGPQPSLASQAQLALFSATIPAPVERLARRFLRDASRISIAPEQVTVPQIEQVAYEIGGMDRLDALARVLDVETPGSAIVFCATRRTVDDVAERLVVRGYRAAALHGDMTQGERDRVMRRFRDGQIEVLVATDVAARGLDIESVTHVINFDIPWDPESYVHRIGRTGRMGRAGDAITLAAPRDYRLLRVIEQLLRRRITRKHLPTLGDVATRRREATKEAVTAAIAGGDLDGYLALATELAEQFDSVDIAAAALRLWDHARSAGADGGVTLAGALKAAEAEAEALERQAERARQAVAEFEADGQAPEAGMARLLVAAGRVDGLRPQDLVGAIANEAGIPGRAIGAIDIYDRFSFVEVPRERAAHVVGALSRTTIRGRRVGARLA
ncbi:MAG: DEAD/DEAH box helicase, partial [Chloroflexota bacterium]